MIEVRKRVIVAALTMSLAGYAAWDNSESFRPDAHIPTKGDVPTIGMGSTRYEDGTRVRLTDPPISIDRARELRKNLNLQEESKFRESIKGVKLYQEEFDVYMDFAGQYGIGNWDKSGMRRALLDGDYLMACKALLRYRYVAGYDCSTMIGGKPNKRCYGVWTRQLDRYNKCMRAQNG